MGHLDLTVVKKSRRTESSLCAISGKTFGKVCSNGYSSKKSVALSVGSINVDSVENKNNSSTFKIQGNTNEEVSFFEQVE